MEDKMNSRELRAINTKHKLLTVSKDLIISNGYENVSVSQICKCCNVAKGTFYNYFESKNDIVVSILQDINEVMFSELMWSEEKTPIIRLTEYQTYYLGKVVYSQGKRVTREIFRIICDKELKSNDFYSYKHQDYLVKTIEQGQKDGSIRTDMDADTIAHLLQDINFGIMMRWCCGENSEDISTSSKRNIDMFIGYIKAIVH